MHPYIFPSVIIGLNTIASVVYFVGGDVRHGLYFLFAGCITASATY